MRFPGAGGPFRPPDCEKGLDNPTSARYTPWHILHYKIIFAIRKSKQDSATSDCTERKPTLIALVTHLPTSLASFCRSSSHSAPLSPAEPIAVNRAAGGLRPGGARST